MSDYLRNFINDHCIVRAPPGYHLKALHEHEDNTWQFYLRRAIFNQNCLFEISKWLYQRHELNEEFQYAAMETAGPPMLSAFKLMGHYFNKPINGFAIRKEKKTYGLMNWIEGFPNLEKPVVILDDMANSKSTILRAADVCKSMNLQVVGARAIVNKKDDSSVDDIPVESMFNLSDFQLNWWEYYDKREEPDIQEYLNMNDNAFLKR